MRHPAQALGWIRTALKPDGVVLIAVPNIESRGQQRRGAAWIWLQQPFVHLWHFSARSLGLLLEKAGFEVLTCRTRDTWDAQYLYDGVVAPQLEGRYFRKLALLAKALLRRLKIGAAERIGEEAFFALCESSRLAFYSLYLIIAPLTGWRDDGSELLVLARIRYSPSEKNLKEDGLGEGASLPHRH
jgi:SAM-dependent methyltransferase